MITAETLPETGRRSPLRRRVVGALVATIAIATMVPTAAQAQSSQKPPPSADNYVTTTVPVPSVPVPSVPAPSVPVPSVPAPSVLAPSVPAPSAPPTVENAASPPSCAPGQAVSGSPGNVVCAAVQGDSGGSSGTLPQTGGSPSMMLALGAMAMVAGAMLLAAARRRRQQLDTKPFPS